MSKKDPVAEIFAEDAIKAIRVDGLVDENDVVLAMLSDEGRAVAFSTDGRDLSIGVVEPGEEPRTLFLGPEFIDLLRTALSLIKHMKCDCIRAGGG